MFDQMYAHKLIKHWNTKQAIQRSEEIYIYIYMLTVDLLFGVPILMLLQFNCLKAELLSCFTLNSRKSVWICLARLFICNYCQSEIR